MKTIGGYAMILILLFSGSCATDEDIPQVGEDPGSGLSACYSPGPPEFTSPPAGTWGRNSINILLQTHIPSVVYYVISDTLLPKNSPDVIKKAALSDTGFITAGLLKSSCDNTDSLNVIHISNLPEGKKLYAWAVAESYVADTTLQNEVVFFTFTTRKRLETASFPSSVKSRDALYVRYVPDEAGFIYPERKLHPLIIFLGGNGEVAPPGEINVIQNGSIPKYLSEGNNIPFIVVAPEHTEEDWNVRFIHEVVQHAIQTYAVDPDRIIITGMSGGGIGTFNYAMAYPDIPAAIVPISGEGDTTQACSLVNMAVWAFHNGKDPKVPSTGSIEMINAINVCNLRPEKEVNLTIFQDEGHNCWIRVYNPESNMWALDTTVQPVNIYDWMSQQSK